METKPTIAVYVADDEAAKFLLFQKYYEPLSLIINHGVFNQKNATILLDFDNLGVLQNIRREDYLFSRRFSK